ncbi:P-loop NTPase [Iamia majanohamensis]|uniref:P-loop NTPase n=1 Tax=Iamia majanohamensis TaxID=467976 RepID=A0AAE9Y8U6_9ACTN|nr:P-loop NTPase [Iamia majanohamensis]WCO69064.1 P-loop NTPase [Iamia majanohamensis]
MTSYLVDDHSSFDGSLPVPEASPQVSQSTAVPPIHVAVVESDAAARARLAMQLGSGVFDYEHFGDFAARLGGTPTIVVLGPSCADPQHLSSLAAVLQPRPEVGAVLVAEELSTELFQQAIRSGVKDVLAAPVDTAQLQEACRRVAESVGAMGRPSDGALTDDEEGDRGRVITVFSTKGGAGKSVVATNLAVALAQRTDEVVALVDCDLQFGDVAVMLKLAPQHTIVDAVGAIDRLDPGFLQNLLVTHPPSGLRVLPAPLEPAYADQISAEHVRTIIATLRRVAKYVIVDTPSYFDDKVLTLIEDCDDVLLVAGMDIPNIKNVKIGLQTMRMLDTPNSKIHLVLNRANTKVRLDVSEVERTLQIKAETQLPSDIVVPQSINKSAPVVLDAPKSSIAKAFETLADRYIPAKTKKKR